LWIELRNWAVPAFAFSFTLLGLVGGFGPHTSRFGDLNRVAVVALMGTEFASSSNFEAHVWANPKLAFTQRDLNLEWNVWSKTSFQATNFNLSRGGDLPSPAFQTNRVQ
jgi:hypothetical protein